TPSSLEPRLISPSPLPAAVTMADGTVWIGKGVKVVGSVSNCSEVNVLGMLEASNIQCKKVTVHKGGVMTGKAKSETAEISGSFEGDLRLSQDIVVKKSGVASGTIRYGGIQVENGGKLFGDIQFATAEVPATA
ncbi:unnamed protein product, partial [Chrysoparadoxa australica]